MTDMLGTASARWQGELVVTRGDGSVDDYGVVVDTGAGPLARLRIALRIRRINRAAYLRGIDLDPATPGIGPLTQLRRKLSP